MTESYPKLEDMQELLQYQSFTLETVQYMEAIDYQESWFDGVQLKFREGFETPLFQTVYGK